MKLLVCMLILTTVAAIPSTHVNISFTQQHSSGRSKIADFQNDQKKINSDNNKDSFAKIQVDDNQAKLNTNNNRNIVPDLRSNHESTIDYRSERVLNAERNKYLGSRSQNQQNSFYNSNHDVHQTHGQFRNLSPQDKQNMEFERYIQNYHSGPTVETVYESAKPDMQHTLAASPIHEGSPQRAVKFERQVALPTTVDSAQSLSDVIKPIANHQSVTAPAATSVGTTSSSSSLSPSLPSVSVGPANVNSYKVNVNQKPVGKDGFDFEYNKQNHNDPAIKYNDGHSGSHFYNQFPPSVEEPHTNYGDYYNNIYNRQQTADDYHQVEQRPIVTKTIQIAQPAIKAKKYEVRHPAIQKEFYDIEERVVIKPAGTVVVELERPSAKILKEETTLPLGHPHPAVAAAYMPTRNTQTFSNIIYSNTGSSSLNYPNNQYIPHANYNNKNGPDQSLEEVIKESNNNKAFIGENHFSAAATADLSKAQNREIVVLTDSHGNQRQISADKAPSRSAYNHRNPLTYEENGRITGQSTISSLRSSFQANQDKREDFTFDAEYINSSGNTNIQKDNKPARLQEATLESTLSGQKQQLQPIIKHEHKIVLSPSQHNIYLSRNQEVPRTKFIEETAEVREIKPYIQNHRNPVVIYAPAKKVQEVKYVQRSEYKPQAIQYQNFSQSNGADNHVQYNAPYAQMRHNLDEEQNAFEQSQKYFNLSQLKSEKLVLEEKSQKDIKQATIGKSIEKELPQSHIEIKIPNRSSDDANKAIIVSSKIRPMMMGDDRIQTENSRLEISVTDNGGRQQEQISNDEIDSSEKTDIDNEDILDKDSEPLSNIENKPDCKQSSTSVTNENSVLATEQHNNGQQKFMRIVESPNSVPVSTVNDATSTAESASVQTKSHPHNANVNVKNSAGHQSPAGSRVIASSVASKESAPSESFHKRRIVVNHPFQTVREVVEHEPYTNYHEVQVNEPATPALYQSANYYQSHGALSQSENRHPISPSYYQ